MWLDFINLNNNFLSLFLMTVFVLSSVNALIDLLKICMAIKT